VSLLEAVTVVNVFAFGLACGGVIVDLRGQKREIARVEKDSKERDAEIERRAAERTTDGDGSRDSRLEKIETRMEALEERIESKFDNLAEEIRDIVSALSGTVSGLAADVRVLTKTKASNPRMPAVREGGE